MDDGKRQRRTINTLYCPPHVTRSLSVIAPSWDSTDRYICGFQQHFKRLYSM